MECPFTHLNCPYLCGRETSRDAADDLVIKNQLFSMIRSLVADRVIDDLKGETDSRLEFVIKRLEVLEKKLEGK